MKKTFLVVALLCITVFATACLQRVYADSNSELGKLKTELQKKGWAPKEVGNIEKSAKELLQQGASKDQLREVLLDLKNKGVSADGLKKSADSMNDLVRAGETPKEAGNIVSRAAHEAQAQGLRGKELAARVHEAIKQRKAEKDALKKKMKDKERKKKDDVQSSQNDFWGAKGKGKEIKGEGGEHKKGGENEVKKEHKGKGKEK